jgi:hypothetical protein
MYLDMQKYIYTYTSSICWHLQPVWINFLVFSFYNSVNKLTFIRKMSFQNEKFDTLSNDELFLSI